MKAEQKDTQIGNREEVIRKSENQPRGFHSQRFQKKRHSKKGWGGYYQEINTGKFPIQESSYVGPTKCPAPRMKKCPGPRHQHELSEQPE